MAELTPRSIEWAESAPVRIEARGESTASPQDVFEVLADHERWPDWFTGVRKVEITGPATGVGARRRVVIPGATVDEEFIVWEPGERWAFTGTAARPRFTRSLVEDCRLEELESGGTRITYTMCLDPPPLLRAVVKVLAGRIRANNRRALAKLAQRAAE